MAETVMLTRRGFVKGGFGVVKSLMSLVSLIRYEIG